MKTFNRIVWLLPLLALGLLAACSSLPGPQDEADTLLVIPVDLQYSSDASFFGRMQIRLVSSDEQIEKYQSINPLSKYAVVRGLPGGRYRIVEERFIYDQAGKATEKVPLNFGFDLEPNSITILNRMLVYQMYQKDGRYWTYHGWSALNDEVARRVLEKLSGEESFAVWSLSKQTRYDAHLAKALKELGL